VSAGGYLERRSLTLAGHRTSIALEPAFWAALARMAEAEGVRLVGLIARVDAEREPSRPLASALRLAALEFEGINRR
jgi:predicted DNA-binding ribbon-helix-helix protein